MSTELIIYLLSWASFYTNYSAPETLPTIEIIDHSYFVSTVCFGVDTHQKPCLARGMYNDKETGAIYLNAKYISEITSDSEATIIHEMVHYLQDLSGDWEGMENWQEDIKCFERSFREREAYAVQRRYLNDVYDETVPLRRMFDRCESNKYVDETS